MNAASRSIDFHTADEPLPDDPTASLAELLAQAKKQYLAFDAAAALESIGHVIRLARRLDDRPALALALSLATRCHYLRGDFAAAVATGIDTCNLHAQSGALEQSSALHSVAFALMSIEDFDSAEQAAALALKRAQDGDGALEIAQAHNAIGAVLHMREELEQALTAYARARKGFAALNLDEREAAATANLGQVWQLLAARYRSEHRDGAGTRALAESLQTMEEDAWRRARRYFLAALKHQSSGTRSHVIRAEIAECELALGHVETARAMLMEAQRHVRARELQPYASRITMLRGEVERVCGNLNEAEKHMRRALTFADTHGPFDMPVQCREALARVARDRGLHVEAAALLADAAAAREARTRAVKALCEAVRPLWSQYLHGKH